MGLFSKAKRALKKVLKPVKRAAQKLVPKEAAGIMQMAAPFMGPVAGPIAYGLGSLKQRGKINPLMMALTMAPHMRWGGGGYGKFTPTGYGDWSKAVKSIGPEGIFAPQLTSRELLFGQGPRGEGILRGPGEWMEEKLWGLPEIDPVYATDPTKLSSRQFQTR